MSRGTLVVTGLCVLLGCGPKAGGVVASAPNYSIVTTSPSGVPLVIVNLTTAPITQLEIADGGSLRDLYETNIKPRGRAELRIDPAKLTNKELSMTIRAGVGILVAPDRPYDMSGPLQVDVVEDESETSALVPGYTLDVRLTKKKTDERAEREAEELVAAQRAQCEGTVAAAKSEPQPGKVKIAGKFKCVFTGAFSGTSSAQIVQSAKGSVTATVTESGGGATTKTTWSGVVVQDQLHFAYNGEGVVAGGTFKIDPTGSALIGKGTSLTDTGCVSFEMTCLR